MIQPLKANRIKIIKIAKADPEIQLVPNALINFVMKHVSMRFLKRIVKIFKEVKRQKENQWQVRIRENPRFYNWIREKLKLFHKYT